MACSGLHCAGCAGGMAVPVVPVVSLLGFAWVAGHLVEVAIVSGACGALAVAAVAAVIRWQDRRQAARGPLSVLRAEVLGPAEPARAMPLSSATHPAIGPAEVHLHFHGATETEQAEAIRRAIGGGSRYLPR